MSKILCLLVALFWFGLGETWAMAAPGGLPRTFQNPQPDVGDDFGRSIAVIGENVLVGAPSDDNPNPCRRP